MTKANESKETLTFEEVKGSENTFRAKVVRDGKVHEIAVVAISEEAFERATEVYLHTENQQLACM